MDAPVTTSPRHRLTVLTAVLMVLVTLPFARSAARLLQAAFTPQMDQQVRLNMIAYDLDPTEFGLFLKLGAVVMAVTCVWAVLLAAGVLLRSEGARMSGLVTFAFLGLVSVLLALGAVGADPRPEGWLLAILTAPVNLAVLGLLASRPVADDVARGTFYRRRARERPAERTVDSSPR